MCLSWAPGLHGWHESNFPLPVWVGAIRYTHAASQPTARHIRLNFADGSAWRIQFPYTTVATTVTVPLPNSVLTSFVNCSFEVDLLSFLPICLPTCLFTFFAFLLLV